VRNGDILLALTDEAFHSYIGTLAKGGIIIADKSVLDESVQAKAGDYKIYHLPVVETAREVVGRVQTTNMVALGLLNKIAGIVPSVSLENAVLARVPKGTEATNKEALRAGEELAEGAEPIVAE
jgi:2-oxoglutarate ferredoxin oxidoreductase subunit gamma